MLRNTIVLILLGLSFPLSAAGEMSSTNYHIYADNIGLDGGTMSSSTSYGLSDTIASQSAGRILGSTYELKGGFQAADPDSSLTINFGQSSVSLGTLSSSQVSSASASFAVSCNSITGYSVSIGSVSGSMINAVADGSVTAGSNEYGLTASGPNSALSSDVAVSGGQLIATSPSSVSNVTTTITFKAAMSGASPAGTYSQTVVFTASANF